jgi:magnesium transporter
MNQGKTNSKVHPKKQSKLHRKIGKSPGTITYMGNREGTVTTLNVLEYDADSFTIHTPDILGEFTVPKDDKTTSWINIVGLSDEKFIENLGASFYLNPLVLEDIVHTRQRPKIDEYEDYIFAILQMLYLDDDNNLVSEHIALILLENSVLVFQELKDDVFDALRERIRNKTGRARHKKADYLFFILIDAIIDNYFIVLESLSDRIEILEAEVYAHPTPKTAQEIQNLKKDVLKIRRWIFPVREIVNRLIDTENKLVTHDTKQFFRDALDHSIEINENLQIYREMSMSLMEMYMSNVSNKMNEVMKVLTIMASIFIPLTFLAGIYGMNFDHLPELHWEYSYYVLLGIMIVIFVVMLLYFKKKRWL